MRRVSIGMISAGLAAAFMVLLPACAATVSDSGGDATDGGGSDGNTIDVSLDPDDQGGTGDGSTDGGGEADTRTTEEKSEFALEQTKTTVQAMMSFVFQRFSVLVAAAPRSPGFTFPCTNGGGINISPDGGSSYSDCSFGPGNLLNGEVRIIPGAEGTQGGRIEFDNFTGTDGGTQFRMDGSIEEIENPDGSLTFEFDVDSSTDDGEYQDRFDFEGRVTVQEDGTMTGTMLQESDLGASLCDFEGANIFDSQTNPDFFDERCRDLGEPPS